MVVLALPSQDYKTFKPDENDEVVSGLKQDGKGDNSTMANVGSSLPAGNDDLRADLSAMKETIQSPSICSRRLEMASAYGQWPH
uniref:Uncharacterized protein n=1 Tax=Trichuris muris TaxID=70415 RepID=A0A5S6PZE8_TRIMR